MYRQFVTNFGTGSYVDERRCRINGRHMPRDSGAPAAVTDQRCDDEHLTTTIILIVVEIVIIIIQILVTIATRLSAFCFLLADNAHYHGRLLRLIVD